MTMRIGILGSTRGTVMQSLIDAGVDISLVLSNKEDAYILERAHKQGIAAEFIPVNGQSRDAYDEKLSSAFRDAGVGFILLIGYMRILSKSFTDAWAGRIINVHPSLLPRHAGLMDEAVYQAVLDSGDTESGCTIHYVDDVLDGGDILLQKKCKIEKSETVQSLKSKVQALEASAYLEAISLLKETA